MSEKQSQIIVLIFLGILTFGAYLLYYEKQFNLKQNGGLTASLADLLNKPDKPLQLKIQNKFSNCKIGISPDSNCTPGAIFADATVSQICAQGYTKSVRNVTQKMREKIYAEYGVEYPKPLGSYEVDHFIPLELGGNNDTANLWTEARDPYPGFREKDVVENFLHIEVCAGHVPLSVAQEVIAADWLAVYNALSSEQIQEIKTKYPSWAK